MSRLPRLRDGAVLQVQGLRIHVMTRARSATAVSCDPSPRHEGPQPAIFTQHQKSRPAPCPCCALPVCRLARAACSLSSACGSTSCGGAAWHISCIVLPRTRCCHTAHALPCAIASSPGQQAPSTHHGGDSQPPALVAHHIQLRVRQARAQHASGGQLAQAQQRRRAAHEEYAGATGEVAH